MSDKTMDRLSGDQEGACAPIISEFIGNLPNPARAQILDDGVGFDSVIARRGAPNEDLFQRSQPTVPENHVRGVVGMGVLAVCASRRLVWLLIRFHPDHSLVFVMRANSRPK